MQIDIHYFRSTNWTVSDYNTRSFDWKKSFQAGAHKSLSVDQFVGRRNESTIWTWDEDAAASTSTSTEGRRPFHSGKPTFRTDQKSRGIHSDCRGGGGGRGFRRGSNRRRPGAQEDERKLSTKLKFQTEIKNWLFFSLTFDRSKISFWNCIRCLLISFPFFSSASELLQCFILSLSVLQCFYFSLQCFCFAAVF